MYLLGNKIVIPQSNNGLINFEIIEDGEPYTLVEGDRVVFSVKKYYFDDAFLIQKTITDQIEITTEDASLPVGDYVYDIKFFGADGRTETILGPEVFTIEKVVNNGE